ncbi:MAG TPA: sulfite exporter TauE/SafE family protein [Capsulimonadaceae bacterium]
MAFVVELSAYSYVLLISSSLAAGAINAVAGGGTVLTFPALLAAGVAPITANATSTISLVIGSFTSAYGYRSEVGEARRLMGWMTIPSLIGGLIGAGLLLHLGDSSFKKLVPWLILGATCLFLIQEPISRTIKARAAKAAESDQSSVEDPPIGVPAPAHDPNNPVGAPLAAALFFQLLVAIYGGFFGAGIGILQLASLGFLGLTNIHRMNAVKTMTSSFINLVATITFIIAGRVDWKIAGIMTIGAVVGGYGGAGLARKVGQATVRKTVIAIGFGIAALMFYRQTHGGM